MEVPRQCSWVIKKVFGAREYLRGTDAELEWLNMPAFSINRIYKVMAGEMQKVDWRRLICQNVAPPKFIFISWLLLQGGMATCEYLQKVGVAVDNICCFCGQCEESLEHLYFNCYVTCDIWEQVIDGCKVRRLKQVWSRERQFLITQCRTNSAIQSMYRCVFTVSVYLIWRERNARRMKGVITRVDEIVHEGKTLVAWCGKKDSRLRRMLSS